MGETGILKPEGQADIPKVGDTAFVNTQSPLQLSSLSEPQPNRLILRSKNDDYAVALPGPEEVLLLVEVADRNLEHDWSTKLRLYG